MNGAKEIELENAQQTTHPFSDTWNKDTPGDTSTQPTPIHPHFHDTPMRYEMPIELVSTRWNLTYVWEISLRQSLFRDARQTLFTAHSKCMIQYSGIIIQNREYRVDVQLKHQYTWSNLTLPTSLCILLSRGNAVRPMINCHYSDTRLHTSVESHMHTLTHRNASHRFTSGNSCEYCCVFYVCIFLGLILLQSLFQSHNTMYDSPSPPSQLQFLSQNNYCQCVMKGTKNQGLRSEY